MYVSVATAGLVLAALAVLFAFALSFRRKFRAEKSARKQLEFSIIQFVTEFGNLVEFELRPIARERGLQMKYSDLHMSHQKSFVAGWSIFLEGKDGGSVVAISFCWASPSETPSLVLQKSGRDTSTSASFIIQTLPLAIEEAQEHIRKNCPIV